MLDATRLRVLVAVARHGSVTAAAQALNYAQPSISHHMARLEAETGAKLMERSGRGVRLTEAGKLLAERAEEILGRLDAAEAELAAHIGLRQERVKVAAFGSALATLVAAAGAALQARRPLDLILTQAEPTEAVRMLRTGEADVAVMFRYTHQDGDGQAVPSSPPPWPAGQGGGDDLRVKFLLDEPVYLITRTAVPQARSAPDGDQADGGRAPRVAPPPALADHSGGRWIAGCDQCSGMLVSMCAQAGFSPDIAGSTDDYHAAQALVAAGFGTTVLPGLALRSARHPGIVATELPGTRRQVFAASYGNAAGSASRLIDALVDAATSADCAASAATAASVRGTSPDGQIAVTRPAQ